MTGSDQAGLTDDAFMERMNNFVAEDPSPRNPRISAYSSHPDRIEAGYQADGHSTWGFVIYRTTYDSDADWAECMRRLLVWAEDDMEFYGGQDVLNLMTWTVFHDQAQFDRADVATVRRHFRDWAKTAVQAEQPLQSDGTPTTIGRSPRYRYCIQVDFASLRSAVHDSPPPLEYDKDKPGWVKLIVKDWMPRSENPVFAGRYLDPTVYEPIEGVTEHDVGWVKCPVPDVMIQYYMHFMDANGYTNDYRRPPAVIGYPYK